MGRLFLLFGGKKGGEMTPRPSKIMKTHDPQSSQKTKVLRRWKLCFASHFYIGSAVLPEETTSLLISKKRVGTTWSGFLLCFSVFKSYPSRQIPELDQWWFLLKVSWRFLGTMRQQGSCAVFGLELRIQWLLFALFCTFVFYSWPTLQSPNLFLESWDCQVKLPTSRHLQKLNCNKASSLLLKSLHQFRFSFYGN